MFRLSPSSPWSIPPLTPWFNAYTAAGLISLLIFVFVFSKRRNTLRLPPGPDRLPLLGNLHNFPQSGWLNAFCSWQMRFGNIVYAYVLGDHVIVLSSFKAADDLLTKGGATYSNRPDSVMTEDMMGWRGFNLVLLQPGKELWKRRSMIQKGLSNTAVRSYRPLLEDATQRLVARVSGFQGHPEDIVNEALSRLFIKVAYGDALSQRDIGELVVANKEAQRRTSEAFMHLWLVNFIPCMKRIPTWTPGAVFHRVGAECRAFVDHIRYRPWEVLLKRRESGVHSQSFAETMIEEIGATDDVRDVTGFLYAASIETSSTTILIFIYAMLLFPEVQARVAAEMDEIVGHKRMPTFADLPNLPYLKAAWTESLRWRPPLPLSIPHRSTTEDVYNGYRIPRGTVIYSNVAFMLNDPSIWPEPRSFKPERFLNTLAPDQFDPKVVIFGFGRRQCPGRDLAEATVYSILMNLIWAFEIKKVDGDDYLDPDNTGFVDAVVSPPKPFNCIFRDRR